MSIPLHTGVDTPINMGVDTPINTDADTPINTDADTPINMGVDTPIHTGVDTPIHTDVDTPINTDADTPIHMGVDSPINMGVDSPIHTDVDSPIDTDVDTPIDTGDPIPHDEGEPIDTGVDTPIDTGADTNNKNIYTRLKTRLEEREDPDQPRARRSGNHTLSPSPSFLPKPDSENQPQQPVTHAIPDPLAYLKNPNHPQPRYDKGYDRLHADAAEHRQVANRYGLSLKEFSEGTDQLLAWFGTATAANLNTIEGDKLLNQAKNALSSLLDMDDTFRNPEGRDAFWVYTQGQWPVSIEGCFKDTTTLLRVASQYLNTQQTQAAMDPIAKAILQLFGQTAMLKTSEVQRYIGGANLLKDNLAKLGYTTEETVVDLYRDATDPTLNPKAAYTTITAKGLLEYASTKAAENLHIQFPERKANEPEIIDYEPASATTGWRPLVGA
ncbi:MAG: hypothetical protein AAF639_14875 [Chloroflexota bacterium]